MNTSVLDAGPILAARDIRKSYGRGAARFDALAGVSLAVHAGESSAIVGKSGSGKPTRMHLLALLDKPDDGSVLVGATDASRLPAQQLNRLRDEELVPSAWGEPGVADGICAAGEAHSGNAIQPIGGAPIPVGLLHEQAASAPPRPHGAARPDS